MGRGKADFYDEARGCYGFIMGGLCLLCCAAPILTIVGITYLVKSATDTRGELTSQYNTAVDAWNSAGRAAFMATSFSAMRAYIGGQWRDYSNNGTGTVFFGSNARDTTWSDDSDKGNDLKSYEAVKYLFQLPYLGTMVEYKCTKGCSTTALQTLGFSSTQVSKTVTGSMEEPSCNSKKGRWINTTRRRRRRTDGRRRYSSGGYGYGDQRREERSGAHKRKTKTRRSYSRAAAGSLRRESGDTGDCTYTLYLNGICQRLDKTAGWTNTLGDAGGCTYTSSGFQVNSYTSASPGVQPKAMLRSTGDPYIKALSLTSGSLDFGRTVEQNRNTGIGCLVAGLVLFLPCVVLCFCLKKMKGGSNYDYPDNYNDAPPVPVTAVTDPYNSGDKAEGGNKGSIEMASNLHDANPVVDPTAPPPSAPPPPVYDQSGMVAPPPPLPLGWEETRNSEGKVYYYNTSTQETSWDRPGSPVLDQGQITQAPALPTHDQFAPAAPPPPLPLGWEEATNSEGKVYYYNTSTQETRWEHPGSHVNQV